MGVKILSVDDEADLEVLLSQKFRRQIRSGEFNFLFAHDGNEALTTLAANPDVDIILSDINMPGMDGLTLLAEVNKYDRPELKTIMVSAYGDMANIRTAMNNGAFDFTQKPIDFDDLQLTIEKTARQCEQLKKAKQEHEKLTSLEQDLHVAKEIQLSILPKVFPPFPENGAFEIYASMCAAKDVGGDFYDFFFISENKLCVAIADISGKGIPAALFMVITKTILKNEATKGGSPEQIISALNNSLCVDNEKSMFATMFFMIFDTDSGEIEFINAGHNPPLIASPNCEFEYMEVKKNIPLAVMEDYPYTSEKLQLPKGGKLFLYTDGVTEATNRANELFGEPELKKFLNINNTLEQRYLIEEAKSAIEKFADGAEQSDDITMLVFQRN